MALLHAIQLFLGSCTTTTSPGATLYTVPTGYRVIIRNIQIRNLSGSAQVATFRIGSSLVFSPTVNAGGSTDVQDLWWVLMPGDTLKCQAAVAAGFNLLVSGSIYSI